MIPAETAPAGCRSGSPRIWLIARYGFTVTLHFQGDTAQAWKIIASSSSTKCLTPNGKPLVFSAPRSRFRYPDRELQTDDESSPHGETRAPEKETTAPHKTDLNWPDPMNHPSAPPQKLVLCAMTKLVALAWRKPSLERAGYKGAHRAQRSGRTPLCFRRNLSIRRSGLLHARHAGPEVALQMRASKPTVPIRCSPATSAPPNPPPPPSTGTSSREAHLLSSSELQQPIGICAHCDQPMTP